MTVGMARQLIVASLAEDSIDRPHSRAKCPVPGCAGINMASLLAGCSLCGRRLVLTPSSLLILVAVLSSVLVSNVAASFRYASHLFSTPLHSTPPQLTCVCAISFSTPLHLLSQWLGTHHLQSCALSHISSRFSNAQYPSCFAA